MAPLYAMAPSGESFMGLPLTKDDENPKRFLNETFMNRMIHRGASKNQRGFPDESTARMPEKGD